MSTTQHRPFTLDIVKWNPWIETVDETGATPEQTAYVDKVAPNPVSRPYYALLAHDLPALIERTALMHDAMYVRGGASRAEREFAATAAARNNGCVHCASVHARLYAQLSKNNDVIQRLLDEGLQTDLPARERAIADYAAKLSSDPAGLAVADLAPLRELGFSDLEIFDLTNVIGMFNWATQLFLSLGENEPPE